MTPNFDFMRLRQIALVVSVAAMLISLVSLGWKGLNWGLDFTGGTLVEIGFEETIDPEAVRRHLETAGYANSVVQHFGTDKELIIRVPVQGEDDQSQIGNAVFASIESVFAGATLRQASFVGPAVGDELADDGALAVLAALAVILVYVMFRFTRQFAISAVVALVHDVIITLGFFSVFQWTFDLPALAAILAVIGYSLNDTIVVADRIRENFRKVRKMEPVALINLSLNETLGRTLMTSGTTLFVVLALLVLGGEMIRSFSAALTIGITVGTYSSIYVAAALLLLMKISREDMIVPEKETGQTGAGDAP
jgi:preprotein translocase subunit SecF